MTAEFVRSNLRLLFLEYNLARLRDGRPELTQEQFGTLVGLSRATINRWMSDKPLEYRKVENETLEKLTSELGHPITKLLTPVDKNGKPVRASLEKPKQPAPGERELVGSFSGL